MLLRVQSMEDREQTSGYEKVKVFGASGKNDYS